MQWEALWGCPWLEASITVGMLVQTTPTVAFCSRLGNEAANQWPHLCAVGDYSEAADGPRSVAFVGLMVSYEAYNQRESSFRGEG